MTKQEYKRLKKLIEQAEKEALQAGIDITSPAFQSVIDKLITQRGFTVEEYSEMENKLKSYIPEGISKIKGDKGDKGDKGEKGDSIKGDKGDKGETGKDSNVRGPAGKDGKDAKDGKDGKNATFMRGKPGKDGKPGLRGKTGAKGNDADPNRIQSLEEATEITTTALKKMPDWRKLGMGLRGDIDANTALIKKEDIWDRSGTTITAKNAGDALNMGTGFASYSSEHADFTDEHQLIDKEYVDDLSIGTYFDFYAYDDASDIGGYKEFKTTPSPDAEVETLVAVAGNATAQAVGARITEDTINIPQLMTVVSSGVFTFHVHMRAATANRIKFYAKLYVRASGGTETLITTTIPTDFISVAGGGYNSHGSITESVMLDSGDRLVVKGYASNASAAATNLWVAIEGETATRVNLAGISSPGQHGSLAGLDGDDHTQYALVSGTRTITVGTSTPSGPATGDLWVDTN